MYPAEFCREICRGVQDQVDVDKKGKYLFAQVRAEDGVTIKQLMNATKEFMQKYRTVEEDNNDTMAEACDDVFGA